MSVSDFRLPTPEVFSGDVGKYAGFLTQCLLQFRQQLHVFVMMGLRFRILSSYCGIVLWLCANPEITYDNFFVSVSECF